MIGIAQMNAGPPSARVAPVISSAPVVGPWKATANSEPVKKPSARLNRGSTPSCRRYSLSLSSRASAPHGTGLVVGHSEPPSFEPGFDLIGES